MFLTPLRTNAFLCLIKHMNTHSKINGYKQDLVTLSSQITMLKTNTG